MIEKTRKQDEENGQVNHVHVRDRELHRFVQFYFSLLSGSFYSGTPSIEYHTVIAVKERENPRVVRIYLSLFILFRFSPR